MILASSLHRASEEPHSSTALNRLGEALFLPWGVSMSSDAPLLAASHAAIRMVAQLEAYGLESRFCALSEQ
jgi:hypothetical protein